MAEYDLYENHWQEDNRAKLDKLHEEAEARLFMLHGILDEFCEKPNARRYDLIETAFVSLGEVLMNFDPPATRKEYKIITDDFRPHEKIYRCSNGGIRTLPQHHKSYRGAIDDSVQDLLNLHRIEIWRLDATDLANVDDPEMIALSPEQLTLMRKVRLLDPLSILEEKLLHNPKLFAESPATLRRSVKTSLKGKEWADVVTRARALAIGLNERGKK